MSSRFLCADLNNIFYAHGGVQNPCYRSIVSNTETFEILLIILVKIIFIKMIFLLKIKNMKNRLVLSMKMGLSLYQIQLVRQGFILYGYR